MKAARREGQLTTGQESHLTRKRDPIASTTDLSAGPINWPDRLVVELIEPLDTPPIVAIN